MEIRSIAAKKRKVYRFLQRGSSGSALIGISLMMLFLMIALLFVVYIQIRILEYDTQIAADSLADGVAVFMASEGGTYEDAVDKMNEIKEKIRETTGTDLSEAVLDEESLEDNKASVKAVAKGTVMEGTSSGQAVTFVITKTAATEFTRRSSVSEIFDVHTDIKYIQWAVDIANDDSHGYCLHSVNQGMGNPDYDCSSLVAFGLREAGYNVPIFSTSYEVSCLSGFGFSVIPYSDSALKSGDILYKSGHTEFYIGNGWNVGAHRSEDASSDYNYGQPGDQTGMEIAPTLNGGAASGWTLILRPPENN